MFTKSSAPEAIHYFLKPGYIFLPKTPTVISAVVGSCVAVCLYDPAKKSGGMNLFQFPQFSKTKPATARFGDISTLTLIRMMMSDGNNGKRLEAQIFGGAHNPEICPENIGRKNVMAARRILTGKGVRIVSEDVGGEKGRKIVFDTQSNEVAVLKVEKLRKGDWFPYENDR